MNSLTTMVVSTVRTVDGKIQQFSFYFFHCVHTTYFKNVTIAISVTEPLMCLSFMPFFVAQKSILKIGILSKSFWWKREKKRKRRPTKLLIFTSIFRKKNIFDQSHSYFIFKQNNKKCQDFSIEVYLILASTIRTDVAIWNIKHGYRMKWNVIKVIVCNSVIKCSCAAHI